MKKKSIVLAAGGTGGHVFPAYALAEHLLKEGHKVYLITDPRGADFRNCPPKLTILTLPLCRSKHGIIARVRLLFSILFSFFLSLGYLLKIRPDVILGFGGFPSAPTMVAGIMLKPFLHSTLMLHEQNAVLGRVNKLFIPFVQALATSFPKTWGIKEKFQSKICVTGNLVRPVFQEIAKTPYKAPSKNSPIHLLVIGGSQGAKAFTTLIPNALAKLPPPIQKRLHVVQQSRPEMVDETVLRYERLHIPVTVSAFFPNIHELISKAHLIICRSGASTLFEIAQAKRPAIYIPFPYAMDNHQYFNARIVADLKGAWLIEENHAAPEALEALLKNLLEDPKKLATVAQNVHDLVERNTCECFSHLIQSL
jgi:UDP-N-acetylglucosamine--N-acetylmuramyl-(pentapeptide) pyrophosphoryl-undecaprenol N-acetylglucosamine transferase